MWECNDQYIIQLESLIGLYLKNARILSEFSRPPYFDHINFFGLTLPESTEIQLQNGTFG